VENLLLSIIISIILSGCASSNITRDVTANTDQGLEHTKDLLSRTGDGTIGDAWQNSSQTTKGAILGASTGALIGGVIYSGVGIIPGTATGLILGTSYGSYIDANTTLQDRLENRGAQIIVLGDQVMVILPSARIFAPETSRIKSGAYATLYLLRDYINSSIKMLVTVTCYTNRMKNREVSIALSQQQAEQVTKFLNAAGVYARVLYAQGLGESHPVVMRNDTGYDSDNDRIEITWEKLNG
jgi:outer membrane protein OmpA-like peptidoglycan-associated protein